MPEQKPSLIKPLLTLTNGSAGKLLNNERGCHEAGVEDFGEDEWQSGSFFQQNPLPSIDENYEQTPKVKHPARRSLLKTPKSIKNLLKQAQDATPTTSTTASPIALDKDKRIRALEAELEELRHFNQTESIERTKHSTETLQSKIDEKTAEVAELVVELDDVRKKVADMEIQLQAVQTELNAAKIERKSAIKAKVFAEQQLTSIEYEFEQHRERASRREKELVDQLNNAGNDDAIKLLKQKLNAMTEKVNTLETQMWQDEKKHKSDLDAIRANVAAEEEKNTKLSNQIISLGKLQIEYDETSLQLVESIEENDSLKRHCETLNATIADLNKQISEIQSHHSNQMSSAKLSDDLQAKLQQQSQAHANKIQAYKEEIEEFKKCIMVQWLKFTNALMNSMQAIRKPMTVK